MEYNPRALRNETRTEMQTPIQLNMIDAKRTFEKGLSAAVMYYELGVHMIIEVKAMTGKKRFSKVRSAVSQDLRKMKRLSKSRTFRRHIINEINDFFETF